MSRKHFWPAAKFCAYLTAIAISGLQFASATPISAEQVTNSSTDSQQQKASVAAGEVNHTDQDSSSQSVATAQALRNVRERIPNLAEVTHNFYRGAQPDAQALADLKAAGVKVDICLDNETEIANDEAVNAKNAGIQFVHIPLNALHRPAQQDISRFLSLVEKRDSEPVYVHCVHGRDRTGTMVALFRIIDQGWSADRAYSEMLDRGFRPFFVSLSNTVFDTGAQYGRSGHKPSPFFIATHLAGSMTPEASEQ